MELYFNKQHEDLRQRVRELAERDIAPVATQLDAESRFPWENVKKMADMGLFGVNVPQEYGGAGMDYISYILVIEELARVDASHSITISAHSTLGSSPILAFGTEEQKQRYLPLLATGRVLGGVRPDRAQRRFGFGRDADDRGARRTAVTALTAARSSSRTQVWARFSWSPRLRNEVRARKASPAFIVTKPTTDLDGRAQRSAWDTRKSSEPFSKGVRAGKKEDKMGWRASDTRELILEDVVRPGRSASG